MQTKYAITTGINGRSRHW